MSTPTEVLARLTARLERIEDEEDARVLIAETLTARRLMLAQRFEPYPWQHPHHHPEQGQHHDDCPPGCTNPHIPTCGPTCVGLPKVELVTHSMWLQLGGRGTGKTEGAARYVNDHVLGPPCDTRIPGGHRILIVAPTQGDGVEACVRGPSGLATINPEVRLVGGGGSAGGITARWPNGTRARILGAYGSEDVERLRAAGNTCLTGDTLVETEHGCRRLDTIRPGDLVWTRTGLRPVVRCESTGVKPVIRLDTDGGRTLTLTPDHPVAWPGGFTRADLTLGGKVYAWRNDHSPMPESPSTSATPATGRTADTGSSIGSSTSARSGPSPTAGTSTTETETGGTTPPPTSSPSTPTRTALNIHMIGIGTLPGAAPAKRLDRSMPSLASGAAWGSSPAIPRPRTAPATSTGHAHGSDGCASCAAQGSSAMSAPPPPPVLDRVRASTPTGSAEVWDLAVEGHHEFIANGLIVGNCLVWLEELAAQRHLYDALDHTQMGLRIGTTPHYVASTTPKPRAELRALLAAPTTVVTKGKTRDAVRLDASILASYLDKYEGTRQGRQELDAELLDDVEGALWSLSSIDLDRWKGPLPTMDKVVVGVDPPGSSGPGSAEAGIIVCGVVNTLTAFTDHLGVEQSHPAVGKPHGFVLADLSGKMTPEEWGRTAVEAFWRYGAVAIAAETTYGGEMVLSTIRTVDDSVPVTKMPTKVGKRLRAEPVVSLYEQHRIHHVGILTGLETQQTEWVPGETPESPDRLDALVHALTYLLVRGGAATASVPQGRRAGRPGSRPGQGLSRAVAQRRLGGR